MCRGEGVLLALAIRYVLFHLVLVTQIEGDRAVNLLQAECWVMRPNGFRRFAELKFPHKVGERHTASHQVDAYSERCRSAFRGDGDRDSELMPITIPR